MIGPGDTCKAVNRESYPITVGWGNISYVLQPNKEAFVPAEAIINFFGDPRSMTNMQRQEEANGQSSWIPDRQTELRRVKIKWQAMNMSGGEDELITPNVDVYTLEGQPVPTVAKDPTGEAVNPAARTLAAEIDRDKLIDRMQAQLDELIRERNIQGQIEPITNESAIPVDDPKPSRSPKNVVTAKAANDE